MTSHPDFDDQGAVFWHTDCEAARAEAAKAGKGLLVQVGRYECGGCRALVEEVVPRPEVRSYLGEHFVGQADEVLAEVGADLRAGDDLFDQRPAAAALVASDLDEQPLAGLRRLGPGGLAVGVPEDRSLVVEVRVAGHGTTPCCFFSPLRFGEQYCSARFSLVKEVPGSEVMVFQGLAAERAQQAASDR